MLSCIVLTKNEEKNIIDCLESVLFCDEIIVIDDESNDRTPEILEHYSKTHAKIKYLKRKLNGDFSAQRKFGVENTTYDWVLFVDADERITLDLANEIKESITPSTVEGGFLIKRTDYMWGKPLKHGDSGNIHLLRLFNKTKGSLKGKVHETWQTDHEVKLLMNPIVHYPHPKISEFLREINFYTDLRALELYKSGKKTGFFRIILHTKGKFFQNYFLKLGFMDGTAGLVHALLMSFHSFLVRGKLYLLWKQEKSA